MSLFSRCWVFFLAVAFGLVPVGAAGAASGNGETPGGLSKFFRTQESKAASAVIDFKIVGGYADMQTGAADSSGRYFLAGHHISRVTASIFKMDLNFSKKLEEDVISFNPPYYFREKRTYYFWYDNGRKMVFKLGDKKVSIPIAKKELMRVKIKSLETYTIERKKLFKNIQLDDAGARIFLQIKFI